MIKKLKIFKINIYCIIYKYIKKEELNKKWPLRKDILKKIEDSFMYSVVKA